MRKISTQKKKKKRKKERKEKCHDRLKKRLKDRVVMFAHIEWAVWSVIRGRHFETKKPNIC